MGFTNRISFIYFSSLTLNSSSSTRLKTNTFFYIKMWRLINSCIVLILAVSSVNCIPVEEDLTITEKEKYALGQFKMAVKHMLPYNYMKTDIYLIKWLRAKNLDLKKSQEMLMNNIRWREENRMEGILDEDFIDFELEFPASTDGTDFTGRPVVEVDASQWNVRKAVINGKKDRLLRYVYRLIESSVQRIYQKQSRGENVTQGITLLNLKGFNLIQHGCVQCISLYINLVMAYENYYPGMVHKIVAINTPATFEVVLTAVKPVMSKDTKQAFTVFGTNEQEWKKFIFSMIPLDQLDRQFGGTKTN